MTGSIIAPLIMLAAAPATSVNEPAAVRVPQPTASTERIPEEQLELSGRSMMSLMRAATPQLRGPAGLSDEARLVMVSGAGKTRFLSGEPMRALLLKMFEPDDKVVFRFAAPAVMVNGRFGRFTREMSVKEGDRKVECLTFYADAVEEKKNRWTFTQITLVSPSFSAPCNLVEE